MADSLSVTQLLQAASDGHADVLGDLMPLVYEELHRLAHGQLRRERASHTFTTTALVHEAYLKLVDQQAVTWQNRAHFYGVAAQAMRRILIDYARRRGRQKRGGDHVRVPFDEALGTFSAEQPEALLALDEALRHLEAVNARLGRVVECRFFGGLSIEETATALGISPATVTRDWRLARAWLKRDLSG